MKYASDDGRNSERQFPAAKTNTQSGSNVDSVASTSTAWRKQRKAWDMIADLRAGTERMRYVREKWLPMEEGETPKSYASRLHRSTLYGALDDCIHGLVSKPFSRPVTLKNAEGLPAELAYLEKDVDGKGTSITTFGAALMDAAVEQGFAVLWVNFPDTTETVRSLRDERELGARPILHVIKADAVIGYRTRENSSGNDELSEIRFVEWSSVDVGKYGDEEVKHVRILRAPPLADSLTQDQFETEEEFVSASKGSWELWRQVEGDKYTLVSEGTHTYPGIPVYPVFTERTGPLEARPPLTDLAWLNVEHWQKKSDLDWAIHHSAFPMLFIRGLSKEERDRVTVIGPSRVYKSTNDKAMMEWVEMVGTAVGKAQDDLSRVEDRMETLGVEPTVDRVTTTATGKHQQSQRRGARILEWVRSIEAALASGYLMAGTWIGKSVPEDFGIDVYSDFVTASIGSTDAETVFGLYDRQLLTPETTLGEFRRRGTLAETLDPEAEIEKMRSAPPIPGNDDDDTGSAFGNDEDEDEDEDEDDDDDEVVEDEDEEEND